MGMRWGRLLLVVLLVGCAEQARLARPSDFPLHATDDPFFDLHWRLERTDAFVQAVGLVEAARVDRIAVVTLELTGVDDAGQAVSRARGDTYGGRLDWWQSQPFRVRLRPNGREARFELKVWSFDWWVHDRGGR